MEGSSLPPEINIITLNCWGLKFNISKLRQPRLVEIGRQLARSSPPPDIVCLQEVWAHADYLAVRRETRSALPHAKFYFSGALGGGLAILSRWPIEESSMVPYVLNGRPTAFWRGDWYVGKGVACARIRYGPGPGDLVEVFCTHTHAPYESDGDDSYRVHREAQAWQLSKLLSGAAARGHLVVAAGDFNMTPLSFAHRVITARAPVRDVWRLLHPDSSLGSADDPVEKERRRGIPSAEFNVLENGATSNNVLNTWRWPKSEQRRLGPGRPGVEIEPGTEDRRAKRLDYIFASTAARDLGGGLVGGWVVKDARVGMMQRHPDLGCSLSDHFSVEATLVFHRTSKRPAPSIASQNWPLPPGRTSSPPGTFGKPALLPLQSASHVDGTTTTDGNLDNHHQHRQHHQHHLDSGNDDDDGALAAGAYLQLQTPTPSTPSTQQQQQQQRDSYFQSQGRSSQAPSAAAAAAAEDYDSQLLSQSPDNMPLAMPDYDSLLAGLDAYVSREATQTRYRALHFILWLAVTLACYVVVWFIPTHGDGLTSSQNHAVNFVLLLLSSLGLVAGVLDGLMALLFFRGSEKRALKEYGWEVRNARCLASGEGTADVDDAGTEKSWGGHRGVALE